MGKFFDGLANLYSRLGTAADRNTQSVYVVPLVSQQQCEAAYRSSWLTRKIHDLPPFEMTRAGRDWDADDEQIPLLEAYERKLAIWGKLRSALTVARLHGGAALILGVRAGGSADPSLPLDVSRVGKDGLRYVYVASRHQLSAPRGMETDPESEWFGQPAAYELQGAKGGRVLIHPSRVIPLHGAPLPPGMLTMSQFDAFWGDPLLLSVKSAIDNAETSQAAVATLLHEMKTDVVSIPGLTSDIASAEAENAIAARIEALNRFKSMFNALLLDAGDDEGKGGEKWETRQLSFAQHPELLRQFVGIVAGAADIPATRLMGEAAGGLQSTGKGEQDDFERMISAKQTAEITPVLTRLDELLIRSALGSRPDEITYSYAPLRPQDEATASEIEKREAETIQIYAASNLIPTDALAKATANRLVESGRWPGLDQAIDESEQELGDPGEGDDTDPVDPPADRAAKVDKMQQRGTVTTDQALTLLTDAAPRPLYVSRKLLNAAEFIAWAKAQGFEATTPAGELHVTVAFSRAPVDWFGVGEAWDYANGDKGGITVSPGGARLVERLGDKGAAVLLFSSSTLSYRHEEIKRAGASWDFPEYQPHVTISYEVPAGLDLAAIEPYRGKLDFGPEIFADVVDDWEKTVTEQ